MPAADALPTERQKMHHRLASMTSSSPGSVLSSEGFGGCAHMGRCDESLGTEHQEAEDAPEAGEYHLQQPWERPVNVLEGVCVRIRRAQ